jgi:hypothetical protein
VSAVLARELAEIARARGFESLDAPVSGGEKGAVTGTLTVMVGGSEAGFARAQPLISTFSNQALRLGPAGAGQLAKMVNQICIAGLWKQASRTSPAPSTRVSYAPRAGRSAGAPRSPGRWTTRAGPCSAAGSLACTLVDWMLPDRRIALGGRAATASSFQSRSWSLTF